MEKKVLIIDNEIYILELIETIINDLESLTFLKAENVK